jgi:hypothetical protein
LELIQKRLGGRILHQKINTYLERNKKLLEDKSEYAKGMEEFNKGNWEKAKELLSKVSEISPYYQDAKSKIEEAQNKIINKRITEAVNKAKTEIQTKQPTESSSLLKTNPTEQSNEITSADLQKILPYVGQVHCYASDVYSEGSASLLAEKGNRAFILTNYHVIEPAIGDYRAKLFF